MTALRAFASISLALLLGAGVARAQTDSTSNQKPHDDQMAGMDHQAGMDHEDMMANATPQMILQKLHMTNLKEIEAGKLAEENGTSKVKDYARMLQSDHQDADAKVTALAKQKGFKLSDTPLKPEMQKKMQMEKDRLSSLKGADFDKMFTGMMAHGHKHLIEMAQAWNSSCKDQDVCALIDTLLPKLQQHLATAEKLRGPMPQGRTP